MKRLLLFLAILTLGCSEDEFAQQPNQPQQVDSAKSKARVQNAFYESGIRDLLTNKEGKTWKDVDNFYKEMLVKYQNSDQLDNLRRYAIGIIVRDYGLTEIKESEILPIVEFYTNEQLTLSYAMPDVLFKCLNKLDGYWSKAQISKAATIGYEKNASFLEKAKGQVRTNDPLDKERMEFMEKLKALIYE